MHPDRKLIELERATDVRWSSKSGSVSKTLQLLDVILESLAEISEESGQIKQSPCYSKFRQRSLSFCLWHLSNYLTPVTTEFFLMCLRLHWSDRISKKRLSKFRENSDGDFDKVLKLTEELNKNHISAWDVTSSRQRKMPARLSDTVVTTSLGKASSIKSNTDLRQMWNAILDRQITELNCRFQEDTWNHASHGLLTAWIRDIWWTWAAEEPERAVWPRPVGLIMD